MDSLSHCWPWGSLTKGSLRPDSSTTSERYTTCFYLIAWAVLQMGSIASCLLLLLETCTQAWRRATNKYPKLAELTPINNLRPRELKSKECLHACCRCLFACKERSEQRWNRQTVSYFAQTILLSTQACCPAHVMLCLSGIYYYTGQEFMWDEQGQLQRLLPINPDVVWELAGWRTILS